jgi:hypothetical protein
MLPAMFRQIITIELDGLTAGDYLSCLRDPEPCALGHALRSVTVRAEPLGSTVEALLVWNHGAPGARAAAHAAGLPVVAEVVAIESREIEAVPAPEPHTERTRRVTVPAPRRDPRGPLARRLGALADRAAARLAATAHPAPRPQPLVLRWA